MKEIGNRAQLTGDLKTKILAGRAVITLVNTKYSIAACHNQTFKVWFKKDYNLWYVFHKTSGKYIYIGSLMIEYLSPMRERISKIYFTTTKKSVHYSDERFKVFEWFWNRVILGDRKFSNLEVWHEGTCCKCGLKLTVPTSIAQGMGPVCAKRSPIIKVE